MKTIVLAVCAVASLSAAASEATLFDATIVSSKSRAEVRAEAVAALARGERLSWGEASHPAALQPIAPTLSRNAVIAELERARANGEIAFGEGPQRGRF